MGQWDKMLVVDIECTCFHDNDEDKPMGWTTPTHQEVVEFGCAIVNVHAYKIEASKAFYAKPHGPIGKFCTDLTTATPEKLENAPRFEEALSNLRDWCLDNKFDQRSMPWGSWGDYDRVQIFRECVRKEVKYPFGRAHYNIKGLFCMFHCIGSRLSVGAAVKNRGWTFEGRPHTGVDDARNIAKLLMTVW